MTITHIRDTELKLKSRRFRYEPKPLEIDTEQLRQQIRLSKDAGHSKLPIFHMHVEKLLDAYEVLNGKPEDLRRKYGESHDDA